MEGMLGEIRLFAGNFAPKGWHLCDGKQLAVRGNEALFSVLGNQYGGDGRTNFNLPKMDGAPASTSKIRYIINISGVFPPRS